MSVYHLGFSLLWNKKVRKVWNSTLERGSVFSAEETALQTSDSHGPPVIWTSLLPSPTLHGPVDLGALPENLPRKNTVKFISKQEIIFVESKVKHTQKKNVCNSHGRYTFTNVKTMAEF